jgi:hypothetical protein
MTLLKAFIWSKLIVLESKKISGSC